jgi:hypothetical protein
MATNPQALNSGRKTNMNVENLARCSMYLLSLGLLVASSGCGGVYDSSARGIVSLDGKSLPRGAVTFHPVSGGPAAYAMIREDGSYSIRTGREEGLPAGEYEVSVSANEPSVAQSSNGGPPPPGKLITPAWYRMKETSGLKFTVKPGKNEINLDLSTKPPAGWNPAKKS